jgi:ribosomal protein S18 acetylase RimI-like enzyme
MSVLQPPSVQPLAVAHLGRAESTLVDAFAGDPMTSHFFPRDCRRQPGLRRIFRIGLRNGQWYGRVDSLHEGRAVAIWLRSDQAGMNLIRLLRTGVIAAAFALGWSSTRRIFRFLRSIEEVRLRSLPQPHWYLFNLAVSPERQSQGLGALLLRHGIARAEERGMPCFLETTNIRNVGFYEKHGFQLVREGRPSGGGPLVWSLIRRVS